MIILQPTRIANPSPAQGGRSGADGSACRVLATVAEATDSWHAAERETQYRSARVSLDEDY